VADNRKGWPPGFVIVQVPNAPLTISLAASLAARLTGGVVRRLCEAIARIALGIWAFGEAIRGVNVYRRLVGLGFLIDILVRRRVSR